MAKSRGRGQNFARTFSAHNFFPFLGPTIIAGPALPLVLKQLDGKILDHLDKEGEIVEELVQSDDFKQGIYEMSVRIDKVCEALPISSPTFSTSATSGGPGGSGSTAKACNRTRLPKKHLRSFNGDITKWTTFWDAYKAAIHTNPELSNIEKFTYLQSLPEGAARDSSGGLAMTSNNYEQAVAILEKRFGNR